MTNRTIAFDMDGVIADLFTPWVAWINDTFGDNLVYETLKGYRIAQQSIAGERANEFLYFPDTYEKVQPFQDYLDVMQELNEMGHRSIVATKASHDPNMIAGKNRWLKRHASCVNYRSIMFIQDKSLVRAHALIDDDPRNLEAFPGKRVLVLHPYNQSYQPENYDHEWFRVSSAEHLRSLLPSILA